MAINYTKINDEILKIARGMKYTVKMFDEFGSGPISSTKKAKFIYLEPDGVMLSVPTGNSSEHDEIYIYIGNKMDETRLRTKTRYFFDQKSWKLMPILLHNWLLISAWVMTFLVLPLLFVWSSLGVIHPQFYERGSLLSEASPQTTAFNASRN